MSTVNADPEAAVSSCCILQLQAEQQTYTVLVKPNGTANSANINTGNLQQSTRLLQHQLCQV